MVKGIVRNIFVQSFMSDQKEKGPKMLFTYLKNPLPAGPSTIYTSYYPTVLVIVQKAHETSTNIPRYCTVGYCIYFLLCGTVRALIRSLH